MRWISTSNTISFSTSQINNNELTLTFLDPITADTHGTMVTCNVITLLPSGLTLANSAVFTIRLYEDCKLIIITYT